MGCSASTAVATSSAKRGQDGSRPGSTRPVTPASHPLVVDIPRIATADKRKTGDEEDTLSTDTVVLATSVEGAGRASTAAEDPQVQASLQASLRPTTSMAETVLKVLLVGPSAAGKTTLATRMEGRNFNDDYTQTAAVQFFFTTLPYEACTKGATALEAPQPLLPPGGSGDQSKEEGTEQTVASGANQPPSQRRASALARQRQLSLQLWDVPGTMMQAHTEAHTNEVRGLPPFAAERFDAALVVVDPASSTAATDAQACVNTVQAHVSQPRPVIYVVATKQDLQGGGNGGSARGNPSMRVLGKDDEGLGATGDLRNARGTAQPQADQEAVKEEAETKKTKPGKTDGSTDGRNTSDSSQASQLRAVDGVVRVFEVSSKLSHSVGAFERQLARALADDCVKP